MSAANLQGIQRVKRPDVIMRPVGGGRFIATQPYITTSGSFAALERVQYVDYLDAYYDLNVFGVAVDYLSVSYDLNAYATSADWFNVSYDLNTYAVNQDFLSAAYDINVFTQQKDWLNVSYDLNAFAERVDFLSTQYDVLAFTKAVDYFNGSYDVNVFTARIDYFNSTYDLNTYAVNQDFLTVQYDVNAFVQKVDYLNSAYDVLAFTAHIDYLDAAYDLNSFVESADYLTASYDVNVYLSCVDFLSCYYDLLANEVFYGWALNLANGAISKYENFNFTSISPRYACGPLGIHTYGGSTDNNTIINGFVETGKLDFKNARVTDYYHMQDGGKLTLSVTTDNTTTAITYTTRATTKEDTQKLNLARGAKGRYWKFKLENVAGSAATVREPEIIIEPLIRKI